MKPRGLGGKRRKLSIAVQRADFVRPLSFQDLEVMTQIRQVRERTAGCPAAEPVWKGPSSGSSA